MARIRAKDTDPEKRLRSALWSAGLRYRIHAKTPVGKPDVVFSGRRVAIFINGCFWHGCPKHYVRPKTRADFWSRKLRINVERDRRQTRDLEASGWKVLHVWEHEIYEDLEGIVSRARQALAGKKMALATDWRVVRVEEISKDENIERRHMEDLRDILVVRHEEGRRVTAKWRRPRKI